MSLDDELAVAFEALVRTRGYENRSEAFRDLLRQDLGKVRLRDRLDEPCGATWVPPVWFDTLSQSALFAVMAGQFGGVVQASMQLFKLLSAG